MARRYFRLKVCPVCREVLCLRRFRRLGGKSTALSAWADTCLACERQIRRNGRRQPD